MYKKFASIFLIVSLSLFIFNLSHAATFTFEEGKYKVYAKYFADAYYDSYLTVLNDLENYEPNFTSPALPDLVIDDALLEKYPYIMFYDNTSSGTAYQYLFILSDVPLLAVNGSNISTKGYLINGSMGNVTPKDTFTNYMYAYYRYGSWAFSSEHSVSDWTIVGGASSCKPIYYANYDVYHNLNNTLVYKASSAEEQLPSMQNPLTNEEIKSILQIFLDSVRNSGLPEHYGRYVLTYNNETDRYVGYVYPSYVNLGMRYGDFDEVGNFYRVEGGVSNYYYFCPYTEDEGYILQFFEGGNLGVSRPLLYEFKSNSTNSYFEYIGNHDMDVVTSPKHSLVNEPIIYTSHKIHSLFWVGNDSFGFAQLEVDEDTSILHQEFVDDAGDSMDTTINEFTNQTNEYINIFSIGKNLILFFSSLLSFLIRFYLFIFTFINIPASTTILPPEFVLGIDWLKTFAFGDILLFDILAIFFGILFSIYIFNLIKDSVS